MRDKNQVEKAFKFAEKIEGIDIKALKNGIECVDIIAVLNETFTESIDTHDISRSGFLVLVELYFAEKNELTPAQLAERIEISRASITATLDKLEKIGFIERLPHPSDRRMIIVRMKKAGKVHIEEKLPVHLSVFSEVFSSFSDREIKELCDKLNKILNEFKRVFEEKTA